MNKDRSVRVERWQDEVEQALAREAERTELLARTLFETPELGFREQKTAGILIDALVGTGARVDSGLAITGVRAELGPSDAPAILLLADMDALPTAGTPGGVAHSCGHHAQMAVMVAAFRALAAARVPERERVRLVFLGTPAEEYVELEYRAQLREQGRVRFLSGKQEMIRLGLLDGATAALKYHSMANRDNMIATINGTLNGFMAKRATFVGTSAHAGAEPDRGVNALNAASLALLAIHAQRETFRDDDHIRVHPIMKSGGTAVNTVPDRAELETYVRGASWEAIRAASAKVDRALAAGAIAIGARVRIDNTPGYQPFRPDARLGDVLGAAAGTVVDTARIDFHDRSYASDDIGDVAALVPTCQLGYSGFSGTIHGADFLCADPVRAYHEPARIIARTALRLALDGGALAASIRSAFMPVFSVDEYIDSLESLFISRTLAWNPDDVPDSR